MKCPCVTVIMLFCAAAMGFSQTNFSQGEELFFWNKPDEAAVYLEYTIAEEPGNIMAFLYLGIVYEQLGRPNEAIDIYYQVLDRAGDLTAYVANNLGNVHFSQENAEEAEQCYTLAIEADASFSSAWLGRANARMKTGSPETAVADYEQYLILHPRAPQGPEIQRLVAFLRTELAAAGDAGGDDAEDIENYEDE